MSSKNVIVLIALIIILFIGGFIYIRSQQTPSLPQPTPQETSVPTPQQLSSETTIEITSSGFSPANVTIKSGGKVTWINNSSQDHQVNSALHPTHLIYPPLNTIDLLKPKEKRSLTFPDKGTYKFHDHLNPQFFGSVTVE